MGRALVPLFFLVDGQWKDAAQVAALRERGHVIVDIPSLGIGEPDVILHPGAWSWDDGQWPLLEKVVMPRIREMKRAKK